MKLWVRWGATLGLVGSTLFGSWFTANLRAIALPYEMIVEILKPVPAFSVTDAQGRPLTVHLPQRQGDNQTVPTAGVFIFISPYDALSFLERLRSEQPDLGNTLQVQGFPLADVYRMKKDSESTGANLHFSLVPAEAQVQFAQQLWEAQRQQNPNLEQKFQGVPLFVMKNNTTQGYVAINWGRGEQKIRFFFVLAEAERVLAQYKTQQPNLYSNVTIEVMALENLINLLESSDNQDLTNIRLIPSQESLKFVR